MYIQLSPYLFLSSSRELSKHAQENILKIAEKYLKSFKNNYLK